MKLHEPNRGSALIVSVITLTIGATLAFSALSISNTHRTELRQSEMQQQADALAESGVERGMHFLRQAMALSPHDPFQRLDTVLEDTSTFPANTTLQTILNDPDDYSFEVSSDELVVRNGRPYGTFTVRLNYETVAGGRNYYITSTGSFPNSNQPQATSTVQAVVRAEVGASKVFDYAYFINNWGYLFGNNFATYGNVRSNGQFDFGYWSPDIHGTPRYDDISGHDLQGYQDDNRDGVTDGSDGGVYSGWNVASAGSVGGMGGHVENQHSFQDKIPMPNLNELGHYEALAKSAGSSIQLGAIDGLGNAVPQNTLSDAVLGDTESEENLVLVGTPSEPIILNGPVVVRGDVIIKGVVTGQGAIYAGRNIYIADDVKYLNPPSTSRPSNNSEASTEAWIAANAGADFLGLFAAENLIMGDFTDTTWEMNVDYWLQHSMNVSAEDSGKDGIPGTLAGMDGVLGSEDDDILEGDGSWSVEYYTDRHDQLGLIPSGYSVGDVVPGSGEDLDGDGVYDPTIRVGDFDFHDALGSSHWAGNLPSGISTYSDLASMVMTHVDGMLFTNHASALVTLATGDFDFFGGIVSQNDSMMYASDSVTITYDQRMSGGGLFESMLPQALDQLTILAWRNLEGGDVDNMDPRF